MLKFRPHSVAAVIATVRTHLRLPRGSGMAILLALGHLMGFGYLRSLGQSFFMLSLTMR